MLALYIAISYKDKPTVIVVNLNNYRRLINKKKVSNKIETYKHRGSRFIRIIRFAIEIWSSPLSRFESSYYVRYDQAETSSIVRLDHHGRSSEIN